MCTLFYFYVSFSEELHSSANMREKNRSKTCFLIFYNINQLTRHVIGVHLSNNRVTQKVCNSCHENATQLIPTVTLLVNIYGNFNNKKIIESVKNADYPQTLLI